eukprot:1395546-Amorphochlora_amoeboformis.AAC.1
MSALTRFSLDLAELSEFHICLFVVTKWDFLLAVIVITARLRGFVSSKPTVYKVNCARLVNIADCH